MKVILHVTRTLVIIALILCFLLPSTVLAASGDLDSNFSGDGKVITNFLAGKSSRAWDVAIQSDGKIVTVGDTDGVATGKDIGIIRYTKGGVLDTTFNSTGKKTIDFNKSYDQGTGMVFDPDTGKIIIVGQTCPGDGSVCNLIIVRLNPNGSFDTTFNGTGKRVDDFGGGDNGSFGAVALQDDGKIVVGGYMYNKTTKNYDFAIHRYTTDGKLDTTFNTTGKKAIAFGSTGMDFVDGIAIQDDGMIVAAGHTCDAAMANCNFALVRLTDNGALDPLFNATGKVVTNLGANDVVTDVAIQTDGKIVVVGRKEAADVNFAVVRYSTIGKLDTTFAGTGKKIFDFTGTGGEDYARSITIQVDNKILVAGYADGDFALARLTSKGALDTTFSLDGKVKVDFGNYDRVNGMAIQPADGKVVLAGFTDDGTSHWAVARVLP